MTQAQANGIQIEFETFGEATNPAIVLISGWGAQLLFWSEGFCERLADRGLFVIRFDNRDVGLSSHLDHLGVPNVGAVRAGTEHPPYTLDDMAQDTVGLLDALAIERAHILGISIGGYIAQLVAINHPDRVLSLISMASAVDGPEVVYAPRDEADLPQVPGLDSHDPVVRRVAEIEDMSSPAYFDRARVQAEVERARARSIAPDGAERQAAAVHAMASRVEALAKVKAPILVLHGALDVALPVENGTRTAAAAPGSTLVVYEDLNHDLPPPLWDRIVDDIVEHTEKSNPL